MLLYRVEQGGIYFVLFNLLSALSAWSHAIVLSQELAAALKLNWMVREIDPCLFFSQLFRIPQLVKPLLL